MTPNELCKAGEKLYSHGWQTRMAKDLDVNPSTVRRWVSGAIPIPGPVAAWIQCRLEQIEANEKR